MTRVSRVDSIASELRDIKRRLHALETALGAVSARTAAATRTDQEPDDSPPKR
ncbi:hypothetical protein [Phytohabitans rumicis]|uniref:Uncharacterized protein n=1 Tax=Phytohabitans rumicis TaxID=1076125 RepID=A0A6V8LM83_9ACTN|nr:hypothetical protein [Phytohabitans rumicis]GFJ95968.1 hypothetical protein Prum_096100 [Phytohabitans rumicis]